jgi:probable HAF family extracellular repeat protein
MNDVGQIAGTATVPFSTSYTFHAFIWTNGVLTDLNDVIPTGSGWSLAWHQTRTTSDR